MRRSRHSSTPSGLSKRVTRSCCGCANAWLYSPAASRRRRSRTPEKAFGRADKRPSSGLAADGFLNPLIGNCTQPVGATAPPRPGMPLRIERPLPFEAGASVDLMLDIRPGIAAATGVAAVMMVTAAAPTAARTRNRVGVQRCGQEHRDGRRRDSCEFSARRQKFPPIFVFNRERRLISLFWLHFPDLTCITTRHARRHTNVP